LSAKALSPHFVSYKIISSEDHQEILSLASPKKAASFLLSRIHAALRAGINDSFYIFLNITEKYANTNSSNISIAIKRELLQLKVTTSSQKNT